MSRRPIEYVAVGIPARNEAQDVARCVRSVLRAIDACGLPAAVVVAADSCTDDTAARVRRAFSTASVRVATDVIETSCSTAGGARQAACTRAVHLLDGDPGSTWLATTDADSVVPQRWLIDHLDHAGDADAVAGLVDVDRSTDERLRRRFAQLQASLGVGPGHPHVHGANIGLRVDAWERAGGFPGVATGEDGALWSRLLCDGATIVAIDGDRVTTSARLIGRAPAGFAAVLAALAVGD